MPASLIATCPLGGLRFTNRALLELHLREDHPRPQPPDDRQGALPAVADPPPRGFHRGCTRVSRSPDIKGPWMPGARVL